MTWLPFLVLLVLLPLLYLSLLLDDATITWLIREEHPIELGGALSLLAASILSVSIWRRARRHSPRGLRWSLLCLAVLFFVSFGEEESWGQRIIGLETPSAVGSANEQKELNFHNLTSLNSLVDSDVLFQLAWFVFGIVIPLVALYAPARKQLARLIPIMPLAIAGALILNEVLKQSFDALLRHDPSLYHSSVFTRAFTAFEIKEAAVQLSIAVGFWLLYRGPLGREGRAGTRQ